MMWKGSEHRWACGECIDKRIGMDRNVVHTTESLR